MSRSLSRRDFLGLGAGAASLAVVSGLGLLGPKRADAVIGIDDAALGGLVLLVATLGGYAFSRTVANVSLDALGYGFSDFVSDTSNQAAAVTQAIADANNLGVELNRTNAETAAQSIAAGTGYFAEVMSSAATSGRVALDNFISGAGELPGVLRNLVAGFIESETSPVSSRMLPGCVSSDMVTSNYSYDDLNAKQAFVSTLGELALLAGIEPTDAAWCIYKVRYRSSNNEVDERVIMWGNGTVNITNDNSRNTNITAISPSSFYIRTASGNNAFGSVMTLGAYNVSSSASVSFYDVATFSGSLVVGDALPLVDRAADAPDVIGPGYDSLPLANDLVIDPSTDEVVSAGSLPLPTSIPDVWGDYVGTLNDILAGVIPGQISLPVSVAEPVVVGTAEGVQSMSITDAIAGDTSLSAAINPPVDPYPPYDPVEPPVDVPEGPWTPAVSLPFEQIWPFNMIYSFVELFEQLGGS